VVPVNTAQPPQQVPPQYQPPPTQYGAYQQQQQPPPQQITFGQSLVQYLILGFAITVGISMVRMVFSEGKFEQIEAVAENEDKDQVDQ